MFIYALMHSKSLFFCTLPHHLRSSIDTQNTLRVVISSPRVAAPTHVGEGAIRTKSGQIYEENLNMQSFALIFKYLGIVLPTQQMLAHESLPTLLREKPCLSAHKVKRQVMYTSTSSPRTTPALVVGRNTAQRYIHDHGAILATTYHPLHEISNSAQPSS